MKYFRFITNNRNIYTYKPYKLHIIDNGFIFVYLLQNEMFSIYCVDIINNMLKKLRYIFFYIILIFKPITNKLINIKSLL